jgi:hypothetical protein
MTICQRTNMLCYRHDTRKAFMNLSTIKRHYSERIRTRFVGLPWPQMKCRHRCMVMSSVSIHDEFVRVASLSASRRITRLHDIVCFFRNEDFVCCLRPGAIAAESAEVMWLTCGKLWPWQNCKATFRTPSQTCSSALASECVCRTIT